MENLTPKNKYYTENRYKIKCQRLEKVIKENRKHIRLLTKTLLGMAQIKAKYKRLERV